MNLINIIYRYINKFINHEELLQELEKFDVSIYKKEEQDEFLELRNSIKQICNTIPNEIDRIEKNRISNINHMLDSFENALNSNNLEKETKDFLEQRKKSLQKELKHTHDGGLLFEKLFSLLTIEKLALKMSDLELLEFITNYIYVPNPPKPTQEEFNDLVHVGVQEDKREALWRLAMNYFRKNKDFSLIEDYFIEKKDAYYLTELISGVEEDLDLKKLKQKLDNTKDKDFIEDVTKILSDYNITL